MANFSRHYFGYFNLSVFGYFCLTLTRASSALYIQGRTCWGFGIPKPQLLPAFERQKTARKRTVFCFKALTYSVRPLYDTLSQIKRTVLQIRLFPHTSNPFVRQSVIQLYEFASQSSSISNRLPNALLVELSISA